VGTVAAANPGPLAASITLFAPVSLLFFFVVGMILAARRASVHPVNYFLLSCAFFAFHLLFAYLIDHVSVGVPFATASAVSLALVASRRRRVALGRDRLRASILAAYAERLRAERVTVRRVGGVTSPERQRAEQRVK
jgi:hypothetical protein